MARTTPSNVSHSMRETAGVSEPHSHSHEHRPRADASVRTSRPNDAPAIGMVQATVFRTAYADVVPASVLEEFDPDQFALAWRDAMANPPTPVHRVLVACAGEQIVGFAAVGPTADTDEAVPEHSGEVLVLAVHPDAHRAGHGSRLLNASADTLRAGHHGGMVAWVLASDEAARTFFTVSGLEPDGAWRDRVVGPGGQLAREVRLVARLGPPE